MHTYLLIDRKFLQNEKGYWPCEEGGTIKYEIGRDSSDEFWLVYRMTFNRNPATDADLMEYSEMIEAEWDNSWGDAYSVGRMARNIDALLGAANDNV